MNILLILMAMSRVSRGLNYNYLIIVENAGHSEKQSEVGKSTFKKKIPVVQANGQLALLDIVPSSVYCYLNVSCERYYKWYRLIVYSVLQFKTL